ncbi:MAG TPA: hypothetical protein VGN13_06960 [Solirubrobacteraceae bacterium]|jgi:hypothetical protein
MAYPYVCRRTTEVTAQGVGRISRSCASAARRVDRALALRDFELWRPRLVRFMLFPMALLLAYWAAWFGDRSLVASDHTPEYIAFEQSFPLADAWLLGAMAMSALQLSRRRPSALLWLTVTGGAGVYLVALDILYDLQHGIYAKPRGGVIELAINVLTLTLSVGLLRFAWRFRSKIAPS